MIQKIRIQNFRSIQDATVELGRVNLFIGPNNSGKSNMMRGIEIMANYLHNDGRSDYFKKINYELDLSKYSIENEDRIIFSMDIPGYQEGILNAFLYIKNGAIDVSFGKRDVFDIDNDTYDRLGDDARRNYEDAYNSFRKFRYILRNVYVYKIDPSRFEFSCPVDLSDGIYNNGSNILPFLFNLSQNSRDNFKDLENSLSNCVGDLVAISTPADSKVKGNLRLKLIDNRGNSYWAEEVSEGVLYFLALLCIIHQPDPPKLLLLEEPEKGIHPRRIQEVMNFIFQLAEEKDIQIIITSHSPYVVDHFSDIPECISVFDKVNGVTQVRNAAHDILEPLNKRNEEQGLPPVRYTDSLGEHWVSGFIGGVPL